MSDDFLRVNGWTIMLHPLFLQQIQETAHKVLANKQKDSENYRKKNASKRLKAILDLSFRNIPLNPANSVYRQGNTLGVKHVHWFRAKFFQQYRLFFRYEQKTKIIIYAWVNDDDTKRAYGSKTDAYAVFNKMLEAKDPPSEWAALEKACRTEEQRRVGAGEPNTREVIEQAGKV